MKTYETKKVFGEITINVSAAYLAAKAEVTLSTTGEWQGLDADEVDLMAKAFTNLAVRMRLLESALLPLPASDKQPGNL